MSQPDTHVRIQPKVYGYTHAMPVKLAAELLNFRKIGKLKKTLAVALRTATDTRLLT